MEGERRADVVGKREEAGERREEGSRRVEGGREDGGVRRNENRGGTRVEAKKKRAYERETKGQVVGRR
jgi:hypothetical protein